MCIYIPLYIHILACVSILLYMYIHTYMCTHTHMYMLLCVHVYAYMFCNWAVNSNYSSEENRSVEEIAMEVFKEEFLKATKSFLIRNIHKQSIN